jgi:hypothetical protein
MQDFFDYSEGPGTMVGRSADGAEIVRNNMAPIDVTGTKSAPSKAAVRVIRPKAEPGGVVNENLDAAASRASMAPGQLSAPDMAVPPSQDQQTANVLKAQGAEAKNARLALAGAQFFADVLNANMKLQQTEGAARLNIIQSRYQAQDAIYRGAQNAMRAEAEGRTEAEDATVALAAQGQNVQGRAVQRIQNSYNAVAAFNAAQERINALREAYGFEMEEVNQRYQVASARNVRDASVIGSALNFGATAWSNR